MNPERMLNQIAEAIKNRPTSAASKYCVYFDASGCHCEPIVSSPPDSFQILEIKNKPDAGNFTKHQWSKILSRINRMQREASA